MQLLKVISRLLGYPEAELFQHASELSAEIRYSKELPLSLRQQLLAHFYNMRRMPLMDLQELYSSLFDHGRSLSLLLFEHVHGESRDRGQAMVDLMAVYERNGFEIAVRELPDYLPLFLEYLSQRPEDEAREWLADVSHILAMLSARLQERDSGYHWLFDALVHLSEAEIDNVELQQRAAAEERDDTMEAFDKVWEAESVRFGAGASAASCSGAPKAAQMAQNEARALNWVDAAARC